MIVLGSLRIEKVVTFHLLHYLTCCIGPTLYLFQFLHYKTHFVPFWRVWHLIPRVTSDPLLILLYMDLLLESEEHWAIPDSLCPPPRGG